MIKVEYSSNNSGGNWWLDDQAWKDLEAAGWNVDWEKDREDSLLKTSEDGRWLGALATRASKSFGSMREAVDEWVRITGENPAAEGCNCCGQPHYFSGEDENGNYVSGPDLVTESRLEW